MLSDIALGIGVLNLVLLAWFISRPVIQDRLESHRIDRENAALDESRSRDRYAFAAGYGRPQHIPASVKARHVAERDRVGDLEPVDEPARGGV
jgi:hypothetical protein